MLYTEYGLKISIEELKQIVEKAENQYKYHNMEPCIYIKGGERPSIMQYSSYSECAPINHTYGVTE